MFKKLLIFLLPTVIVAGIVIAGPYAGGPYVNTSAINADGSGAILPDARVNLNAWPVVSPFDYGAKGDTVTFTDGQITSGTNIFTSSLSTFTSADVGKIIVVSGAGAAGVPLVTTISGFTSTHVVTLTANASTTVPTYTATSYPPVVATSQSGAGSYVSNDTITLSDSTVLTVVATKVASASAGTNGVGCTDGTYTVTGTTGLSPSGVIQPFTANVTVTTNVPTVNSITSGGDYSTNPTSLANEPITGVTGCSTQPKLALKMGVKTAYVSTVHTDNSIPSNPVSQSSTSGSGTGATFTFAGWTQTGQGYYGTDDSTAFQDAIDAAAIDTAVPSTYASQSANFIGVPAGNYIIATQLENKNGVTLIGAGNYATMLFAGASGMTAVFHKSTTYGFGGGARDIGFDAFKLADHAIYVEGGTNQKYEYVVGKNALVSEWRCGNGTTSSTQHHFRDIEGFTDPHVFPTSLLPTSNFWMNGSPTNGCTDSTVDGKSTFWNATTQNILDDAGAGNNYVSPHTYGYPNILNHATYGIELRGQATLIGVQSDGAVTAGVFVNGTRISVHGGTAQWTNDSQRTSKGVLIASGISRSVITGISATGTTIGVSADNAISQAGTASSTTIVQNNPGANYSSPPVAPAQAILPQGRLTLQSGSAIMTADQSAKSTIYYTTYNGLSVPVYNGINDTLLTITNGEISIGLDSGTPHVASGSVYDIFGVNSSGSLALCVGPAWSTTTARGTGAGTTQIHNTRGFWTNQNSLTNCWGGSAGTTDLGTIAADKGTYLGSFYATANGQTTVTMNPAPASGGGNAILGLYNAYNRILTSASSIDSNGSWTYNVATWRSADNNNNNRVTWLDGLQQSSIKAEYIVPAAGTSSTAQIGVNIDSTSATPTIISKVSTTGFGTPIATATSAPLLGLHYAQAMEEPSTAATVTYNAHATTILLVSN